MTTFVLATANAHKANEMRAVLADLDATLLPRPVDVPDVDETEDTLEGNAGLKARALVEATGYPALADDTGLFVSALGGRPGVFSARYAGDEASYEDNVRKLNCGTCRSNDAALSFARSSSPSSPVRGPSWYWERLREPSP